MQRALILLGVLLVSIGLLMPVLRKVPYIGRLPGDIRIERPGFTFFFPLATCILLSLLLTLILRLVRR